MVNYAKSVIETFQYVHTFRIISIRPLKQCFKVNNNNNKYSDSVSVSTTFFAMSISAICLGTACLFDVSKDRRVKLDWDEDFFASSHSQPDY